MLVQDTRTPMDKVLNVAGIIVIELGKVLWISIKGFCMGWATCAVLFQKPGKWDPLTKATIFFVGRSALLGKRKTIKRRRYLK